MSKFDELELTPKNLGFKSGKPGVWYKYLQRRNNSGQIVMRFEVVHDIETMEEIVSLQKQVWGFADRELVPSNILRIVANTGGHIIAAYNGNRLVGFVFGFGGTDENGNLSMTSHMMGVLPQYQGKGIGRELKLLQACLAYENGYGRMTWTYDPLRSANAHLNFRLGVICQEYLVDYYGSGIQSGLYAGMPTDRLVAEWYLDDPEVQEQLLMGKKPLTLADIADIPFASPGNYPKAETVKFSIPSDIDAVRGPEPHWPMTWWPRAFTDYAVNLEKVRSHRMWARHILNHYLNEQPKGARRYYVTDFVSGIEENGQRQSWYVLTRSQMIVE